MKKIIQRTRRFEKHFKKLVPKTQLLFIKRLKWFIEDEYHHSLDTHRLKGKRKYELAFSVTDDIRAIYVKEERGNKTIIVFTFIDIGSHNKVY
jgi:mRNA-degrading endonuclease YafQ of YafQ-DinJ toxin-antitoxin module